jgi:Apolipoprotein N-acyltransferase
MAIYPGLSYLGGVSLGYAFRDQSQVTAQSNYVASEQFYYNDYNSAMFFTGLSNTQVYHKSKLVVGVENFPYKGFLQPLLGDVMLDLGGTVATKTTQDQRDVFALPNEVKVAPAICYESVYGDFVTGFVRNGAGLITVITNDAWWGDTQGHQQHLAFSRLRAIENRRFVVRSANTGISAIVNPLGEITQQLGYEEEGSFAARVYAQEGLTFTPDTEIISHVWR